VLFTKRRPGGGYVIVLSVIRSVILWFILSLSTKLVVKHGQAVTL